MWGSVGCGKIVGCKDDMGEMRKNVGGGEKRWKR